MIHYFGLTVEQNLFHWTSIYNANMNLFNIVRWNYIFEMNGIYKIKYKADANKGIK
jgi:hypothetical protein